MVVNELYYGQQEVSTRRAFPTSVVAEASGVSIDDDIIAAALRNIYRRDFNPHTDIEPNLFNAIAHTLGEAVSTAAPSLGDDPFTHALRHSTDVFSAFKVHRAQNDMAARLLDSNGNLKPFNQWRDEVLPIADHQCHNWLETEYNTAVLRARQAANWQQFQAEKDILPNLKWLPSTSPNPGADHRPFWNTILPVDHPFWNEHRPGDRWNCKCDLTSTDEPATGVPGGSPAGNNPQPGLKDNPGKSQAVFSDDHPYFPADCKHCPFYKPGVKARIANIFKAEGKKGQCMNCPYVDACIENVRDKIQQGVQPPHIEDYTKMPGKEVYTSPYHGRNELLENQRLAEFLFDKLNEPVYLLPRLDSTNARQAALRRILLPPDVYSGKNPDFMIWGMLFDAKSMASIEYNGDWDNSKRKIENRFKSAKMQADNFFIEISDTYPRSLIHETVTNYLERMTNIRRVIMIKWHNKLFVYTNKKR